MLLIERTSGQPQKLWELLNAYDKYVGFVDFVDDKKYLGLRWEALLWQLDLAICSQ